MKDKLKYFIELILLPLLENKTDGIIRGINVVEYDYNDYNNKYYPNIVIFIDDYLSLFEQERVKELIVTQVEQFFPGIFVVLKANIKFDRVKTDIDE